VFFLLNIFYSFCRIIIRTSTLSMLFYVVWCKGQYLIHLADDWSQLRTVLNTALDLRVTWRVGNLLAESPAFRALYSSISYCQYESQHYAFCLSGLTFLTI